MVRNIPNALTVFRILLIPLFLYLACTGSLYRAIIVFAVAGLTDALDGFIARAYDMRTEFGAHLDPLADKLLLISAFLILTYMGLIPVWLCVPVIARDVVILAGVIALRGSGRRVRILPTISGKVTTTLQIATVLFAMVFTGRHAGLFTPLAALTLAFTLYSGFEYAWREIKVQKKA
ncbi:MAG: CDP-diacylglycerol--glycerol-3-phosphate 3-phosphatidyltransferase [Thermodesulfobacteriota bacterium]